MYDEVIEGKEFELLPLKIFTDIALGEFELLEKHVKAITILMSDHFIGESFDFNYFEEIFKQMGIIKKETTTINNKSIRIINRLKKYLAINKITDIEKLLGWHIYEQTIRVKNKEIKVSTFEYKLTFV
jgi:hypothetical protein